MAGGAIAENLGMDASIGGIARFVVGIGARFEHTMQRVRALTRASGDEFQRLEDLARQIGRDTEFTAPQAAAAMSNLALAGFKVNDILAATPSVVKLASVGQVELADSADFTATMMAGMGIESGRLNEIVDKLAYALTNSNSDMLQLKDAFKFAGPIAKTAGRSFDETAAAIMALHDAGLKGEMAGTALRNITMKMADKSLDAQRTMETLGISFVDSAGKGKAFADIIDHIKERFKALGLTRDEQIEVLGTIFEMRAGTGLAALLDQSDKIRKNMKGLKEESKGLAGEIQTTQLDSVTGKWTIFKSSVENLGISLFKVVNGPLRFVIDELTRVANAVDTVIRAFDRFNLDRIGRGLGSASESLFPGLSAGAEDAVAELKKARASTYYGRLEGEKSPKDMSYHERLAHEARLADLARESRKKADIDPKATAEAMKATAEKERASLRKRTELFEALKHTREELERNVATFGKGADAIKLYELQQKGATRADLAGVAGMQQKLAALEKTKALQDEARDVLKEMQTPAEQFTAKAARLQEMLVSGAFTWEQYAAAVQFAGRALAGTGAEGAAALEFGSAAAVSAVNRFRSSDADRANPNAMVEKLLAEGKRIAEAQLQELRKANQDRGNVIP